MNVKRCVAFLMSAVMGLSLTACGGGNGVREQEESGAVELKIGVNGEPEFDPEPEPELLPEFASLFGGDAQTPDTSGAGTSDTSDAGTFDAPISGEIVKAVYPEAVPYPQEDAYFRDGGFDNDAYFAAYEKWSDANRARPDLTPEELAPLLAFFRDGTREFLKGDDNRAYSPVNVYMALAMLSGLTAGNSQKQIMSLLGAESPDALASQANRVWNALYNDDGTSTTLLGSSLWLNENVHFNADTLKKLSETFYASSYAGKMGSAEFDNALQTWLNQQTRDCCPNRREASRCRRIRSWRWRRRFISKPTGAISLTRRARSPTYSTPPTAIGTRRLCVRRSRGVTIRATDSTRFASLCKAAKCG